MNLLILVFLEGEGVPLASLVEASRIHAKPTLTTPMGGGESTNPSVIKPLLNTVALQDLPSPRLLLLSVVSTLCTITLRHSSPR